MQRAIVYIDGFNLYHGIVDSGWRCYLWLDLQSFSQKLLSHKQRLATVRYFTARRLNPDKEKRQRSYIAALEEFCGLTPFYGAYKEKEMNCSNCGGRIRHCPECKNRLKIAEEKMSDVNLAVEMTCDAFTDEFDTAIIVSGDNDFVGLVRSIRKRFRKKQVILYFPPMRDRNVDNLKQVASNHFTITEEMLQNSQLPNEVSKRDGSKLIRPAEWR